MKLRPGKVGSIGRCSLPMRGSPGVFYVAQGLLIFQLYKLCYLCIDELREGDLSFVICKHSTMNLLIQRYATTDPVLISSTSNILMNTYGIVNGINQY